MSQTRFLAAILAADVAELDDTCDGL